MKKLILSLICTRAGDCVWFAVVLRAKAARIIEKFSRMFLPLFVAFCAGLATASRIQEAHSAGKPKLA